MHASSNEFTTKLLAAQEGESVALESLGIAYFQATSMPANMELAREDLLTAANGGDLEAQHSLGCFYFFGIGGDRSEVDAVKWFRKAAEQGHANAQHRMGRAYRSQLGFGVSADDAEAVKWFRKATEQGHVQAQYDLARQLLYGEGVAKNAEEAVTLWRQIAEKGHAAAQSMLGRCYAKGEGVPKDAVESKRWTEMAAGQNYPGAKERLSGRPIRALKNLGYLALYLALLVGLFLVGAMFLRGGVWLSERITPWLFTTSWVVLVLAVLGLLPLCVSKETRGVGGLGLTFVSYVFGATLWFWSLLITYTLWGWVALIIGLVIAGVGVLPIALLATAIKGEWTVFGELLFLMVATFGTRGMGLYFVNRNAGDPGETDMPVKLIVATWLFFGASFIPYIGYFTSIPFLACAVALLFSKNPRARRHGKISGAIALVLLVIAFVLGVVFYQRIPPLK